MAPLSIQSLSVLSRLRAYNPTATRWSALPVSRKAGVLILLFADNFGDLRVVLTMRAKTLKSFPGQAALPGGKADKEDELPFDIARREADEEIGLPQETSKLPYPFRVEHICEMPAYLSRNELAVKPCIAFLHSGGMNAEESLIPRLDAREVEDVFSAPFHNFLKDRDEIREGEQVIGNARDWYSGSWSSWHEKQWRMHQFFVLSREQRRRSTEPSDQAERPKLPTRHRVWGMTAKILVDAARIAYGEEPNFIFNDHLGDEEMVERLQVIGRMNAERKPDDQLTRADMDKAAKI